MTDFISNQPHPETNESACTWLSPDAESLIPLWSKPVVSTAGTLWKENTWLAAVFSDDPSEVIIYRTGHESILSESVRHHDKNPVRHISLFHSQNQLMLGVLTDEIRIYDALTDSYKGSIATGHHQPSICAVNDELYLTEGNAITKLDDNLCRTGESYTVSAANTSNYNYGARKDALEMNQRINPGTSNGLVFYAHNRIIYACNDLFNRCGQECTDIFFCHAEHLNGPFSRRYLAIPSARCFSFFTDASGTLLALIIGTETSACPGRAALVKLEWADGEYLRPCRNQITEKAVTARMRPLPFTREIRDSFVYNAPDGWYYLTGTTKRDSGTYWSWTNGIHVWRTKDFSTFEDLGIVYDYTTSTDCWQMQVSARKNTWAPEITYYAGTFWLTYSTAPGCGLLKSISGLAQGPYLDMGRVVMKGIDSGFYVENDQMYLIWQNGMIAPFNESCSTFKKDPQLLLPIDGQQVGYEGAGLIRVNDKYVLYAAEWNGDMRIDGTYDMMYSVSDTLYGPYSPRRILVPHGGHGSLFYSKEGELCFSMFGNDRTAAFRHGFGIGRIRVSTCQGNPQLKPCEL